MWMLDQLGLGTFQKKKTAPTHQAMRNLEVANTGLPHQTIQVTHQVRYETNSMLFIFNLVQIHRAPLAYLQVYLWDQVNEPGNWDDQIDGPWER